MIEDVFLFYRKAFVNYEVSNGAFLTFLNPHFNHPVLSPNFKTRSQVTAAEWNSNRAIFKTRGLPYWVNVFEKFSIDTGNLVPETRCEYLFYTAPVKYTARPLEIKPFDMLPSVVRLQANQRLCEASQNLSVSTLEKIETVLRHSKGRFEKWVAINSEEEPIGGYSLLVKDETALILNAWVFPAYRQKGILNFLTGTRLKGFLEEEGGRLGFAWTLNPILRRKGNFTKTLTVFRDTCDAPRNNC